MSRLYVRLLILLLNVPQIASAMALAVYLIWFDRYEWKNVGPSVTYAAYTLFFVLVTQLGNGVAWVCLRKNKAMTGFLGRVALISFTCVILFSWLGGKFVYAGA
jgi:hypothetical protein